MAKALVSEELWAVVAPLLPPPRPRPKGGRPPVDDRKALAGILFVLQSGIPWAMLPQEMGCGCGMTCWRRLRDWQKAGAWAELHRVLLDRLGRANAIDWSRCSLDSASFPAKGGGELTGPNPTDRAKPGSKRHVLVEAAGIPLAFLLTPANVHDSTMLEPLLDAVPPIRQCAGRGDARESCTPMKATTTAVAAAPVASAASFPASRGAGSRAANGWVGTAGLSNARSPGSPASVGWRSATSAGPTSSKPSTTSPPP